MNKHQRAAKRERTRNNYFEFYQGKKLVGTIWKIGKFWCASDMVSNTNLGGAKSFRHARQRLNKSLHQSGRVQPPSFEARR